MTLPSILQPLTLPVLASPMFIVSYPELVSAQRKAGVSGSFPALNARSTILLDEWLHQINEECTEFSTTHPDQLVGPLAVNQIVHPSNSRLEADVRVCIEHKVPIFITSLHAPIKEIIDAVHAYGGIVLHDVINLQHAHKALEAGVDGLILVAAGAGGHGGTLSPFALVGEVRRFFDGPLALAGAITSGSDIFAARAMGADLAYMGTRFIATREANASEHYKDAVLKAKAADILYTNFFTGVHGNYLRSSIVRSGLNPDQLPASGQAKINVDSGTARAWRDIWGAGQGVGLINDLPTVDELIKRLKDEYDKARQQFA